MEWVVPLGQYAEEVGGTEADAGFFGAVLNDLFEAIESAATDEQNIGRVDLQKVLVRVLAGHNKVAAFLLRHLPEALVKAVLAAGSKRFHLD